MTALHQAAQKAVEMERAAFEAHTARTRMVAGAPPFNAEKTFYRVEGGRYFMGWLQSQWEGWQARAALQHQEEPREPVADFDTWQQNPYTKVLMDSIKNDYMPRADAEALIRAAASPSTTRQQEVATWLLYEHEDGHHAVAPTAEAATFAQGDPAWHRVGPVEVSSESLPYRSAAGDTLASIAQAELRDMNRWPEILSLNTHVLDGADGPGSKPRAGTLLTLPRPSTARQQEVGSVPAEVIAWRDAYAEYIAASDAYNARLTAIREREAAHQSEFGRDNPQAEWKAVDKAHGKWHALLRPMFDALAAAPPTPAREEAGLPAVDPAFRHAPHCGARLVTAGECTCGLPAVDSQTNPPADGGKPE